MNMLDACTECSTDGLHHCKLVKHEPYNMMLPAANITSQRSVYKEMAYHSIVNTVSRNVHKGAYPSSAVICSMYRLSTMDTAGDNNKLLHNECKMMSGTENLPGRLGSVHERMYPQAETPAQLGNTLQVHMQSGRLFL